MLTPLTGLAINATSVFRSSFLALLGLSLGSFVACVSYRLPRSESYLKGRSHCPRCKKTISWYYNLPLVSYIVLGAHCHYCQQKISLRYPLIEGGTALLFVLLGGFWDLILTQISWLKGLSGFGFIYLLFLGLILITIFVIDFEHQLIPDDLVYLGILLSLIGLVLSGSESVYVNSLAGLAAALFLLSINLLTRGCGMGLGDVKLALLLGLILGPVGILVNFFLAFLTGALVGIILILTKKGSWKQKIAFGPFLIVGFVLALFWGQGLADYFWFF